MRMDSRSVPAQRVLGHNRCGDLLCTNALSAAAGAPMAATATRCHTTIASTTHPSSGASRNRTVGHTAGAGNGAGARVSDALVAVPASDEEHSRAVGHSTNDSSGGDTCTGRVDLAAGSGITSKGTAIASASSRGRGRVITSDVGATRNGTACCQRTSSVDQVGQIVDGGVLVVPKWVSRVAQLSSEFGLQVLGDGEHRHGGDEALVLCGVKRLQSVVLDLGSRDVKTIGDSHRQVVKDLVAIVLAASHEGVVQWPLEAHLTHEGVLRDLAGNATRGSDHPWQAGGNANAGRGSGRGN